MPTIVYRGTRAELLASLSALPAVLAGHSPDRSGVARDALHAVGVAVAGAMQAQALAARGETSVPTDAPLALAPTPDPDRVKSEQARFRRLSPSVQAAAGQQVRAIAGQRMRQEQAATRQKLADLKVQLRQGTITQAQYDRRKAKLDKPPPPSERREVAKQQALGKVLKQLGPPPAARTVVVQPGSVSLVPPADAARKSWGPPGGGGLPDVWRALARQTLVEQVSTVDFWQRYLGT